MENLQITTNFKRSEFDCKDGTKVPDKFIPNLKILCQNLEIIRSEFNAPVIITGSGYRTEKHNNSVGGAKNSKHLTAEAGDINVKGFTPKQVYDKIEALIKEGKLKEGGLGLYKTFVHYDVRGVKARWNNS